MYAVHISRSVALLLFVIAEVRGFAHFRDLIPNGKNVPHPCRPNYLWKGVGHENIAGGGVRNPFGKDFEANGKVWDECLCQTDSDGDGKTNGEELGDPECVWTPGDVPFTKLGLSHPGICEPIDSGFCKDKNDWEIDCSNPEFTCDELDKTEDVRNVTFQLTPTPVPPKETTYICQGFDAPSDGAFHMIASEPLIVNENVMHHIVVFSCPNDAIEDAKSRYSEPVECDMAPWPCVEMFTLWSVGVSGYCLSSQYGLPMGQGGPQYLILQMHWNNPELKDNYEDSSGLILHYTPNLRPYSGATLSVGPVYFELPPGYSQITDDGVCSGECTEYMFEESIYIAEILPHMHYSGRKMRVEQWRDGQLYATLVNDEEYSYDSPQAYQFQPAIEIKPGDELNVSCTFETKNQEYFTFFGEATADEMCTAIAMYYPTQANGGYCSIISEHITYCGKLVTNSEIAQQCVEESGIFFDLHFDDVFNQLYTKCDPKGLSCWDGCKELIAELRTNYTCLHEEADEYIKNTVFYIEELPNEFIYMMISCNEWPDDRDSSQYSHRVDPSSSLCFPHPSSAVPLHLSAVMLVMSLVINVLF